MTPSGTPQLVEEVHEAQPVKDGVSPRLLNSFSRSQISSFIATIADYGLLFLLTEVIHVWYVAATAAGALVGAISNFFLNRHWSFQAQRGRLSHQARRYVIVSLMSLLINTGGVYMMTEWGHLHYAVSVTIVSLAVGFGFNYPLHKRYVYRVS